MTTAEQKLSNFRKFSKASMAWGTEQSEQASGLVMEIITSLTRDSKRISKMSTETLDALKNVKELIQVQIDDKSGEATLNLTRALHILRKEHDEIDDIINPIIESLQFQDRITQNMENLSQMIDLWREMRGNTADQDIIDDAQIKKFAEDLFDITTMKDERDIIRNHIPGLPIEEEGVDDVMMF